MPELLKAGHHVVGLTRSDQSAEMLRKAGAEVHRGSLDDLESLKAAAQAADGVIHLAFKHDLAFSGDMEGAAQADLKAQAAALLPATASQPVSAEHFYRGGGGKARSTTQDFHGTNARTISLGTPTLFGTDTSSRGFAKNKSHLRHDQRLT